MRSGCRLRPLGIDDHEFLPCLLLDRNAGRIGQRADHVSNPRLDRRLDRDPADDDAGDHLGAVALAALIKITPEVAIVEHKSMGYALLFAGSPGWA